MHSKRYVFFTLLLILQVCRSDKKMMEKLNVFNANQKFDSFESTTKFVISVLKKGLDIGCDVYKEFFASE